MSSCLRAWERGIQAFHCPDPRSLCRMAAGMGASFNKEFFCAGNNNTSINIVMTEISNVLDL